jgi:hypothetical protein
MLLFPVYNFVPGTMAAPWFEKVRIEVGKGSSSILGRIFGLLK